MLVLVPLSFVLKSLPSVSADSLISDTKIEANFMDINGNQMNVLELHAFNDNIGTVHLDVVLDPSGARKHINVRVRNLAGNKLVLQGLEVYPDPDYPITLWDADILV